MASDVAVVLAFALGTDHRPASPPARSAMRSDVKGALAWSTVGQMAFMVVQCAVGAFSSAVFHIIGHGMYKAALFLGCGRHGLGRPAERRDGRARTPITTPLVAGQRP